MEFDRRVQIRVRRAGRNTRGFGSGYLIAPRLVLTAEHVLNEMDPSGEVGTVTVCRPDTSDREFPATVRWRRQSNALDAALIEIDDTPHWPVPESLTDLLTRPPQRFGQLIGPRPHQVGLTGFPRLQKDLLGSRLDEHLTGHIKLGTGALADRYEITSTDPTPAGPPAKSGSRWSGISGAAVLADDGYGQDLLCGTVRRDRIADGGTRLTATTAACLLADPGFRTLVAQHTGWEPVLEPIEPIALLHSAAVDRTFRSPAALLRADAEAVSFQGRDRELTSLRAWCEKGTAALAIRVMTGPGGQGKSRLARRLSDTLSREGWVTGHLRSDLTDDPAIDGHPPDFTTLNTALPLFLVVDYAETRPRLLRRLITHLHGSRHRVRLLLVARADGDWRTGSFQSVPAVRDLLEEAPITLLAPLITADHPEDRHTAFGSAVRDLARLLPQLPSLPPHDWASLAAALQPPADMHDRRYDNVLTLQMTALVHLLQRGPRPADTAHGTPPERTLLKHEDRFWEASAKTSAHHLGLEAATLGAAVAVAAMCGAGTQDEALRVISTLPGLPAHKTVSTAAWLASLYPATGTRYWGSLQPDRVAEFHASHAVDDGGVPLPSILAAGSNGQQVQTVTVLARAAISHYNSGRTEDSVRVLQILDATLDKTSLPHLALQAATAALPHPSRITAPLALKLTSALAQADRRLAVENPSAHEPDLAASLTKLSVDLSDVGRRDEALDAAEEAVSIRRRLAAGDPATHEPDLSTSLANLGVRYWDVGRHTEALDAAEDAVSIRHRLAAGDPATHEPDLSTSLANLGNHLSEVGRYTEALTATEEALHIRRRLAAGNPAAYEPDLASSLSDFGNHLSEVGRYAEALTAEEEALGIRRRLAADNPAAHEPHLALSLSNFSVDLSEVGRHAEALAATEEALDIRRRLAADNPAAYEPDLARSLVNLSADLSEMGRHAEALTAADEAVRIRRRLAAGNPAAYTPGLALALSNLASPLSEVRRHAEALTAAEEALDIRRGLVADNPAAHEPALARSLASVSVRLGALGRHTEALNAAEEALDIRRRLVADNPAAHELDLASSLSEIAGLHAAQDDASRALGTTEEAVEIYRRHLATTPTLLPALHKVLEMQSSVLDHLGRPEAAEAVQFWLRENPVPADPHT
ncbi:tetratricopeptide repeat protein [Streptomyces sp. NPDC059446]|uniref:tetratricopeptide repeat protein n=1 Tax=Streptomyces sp. NPDC059446 TaxID=3346833 RepID=UPI0036CE4D3F